MSACLKCGLFTVTELCGDCRRCEDALRAEVRDLKARLREVREQMRHAVHNGAISLYTANELRAVADTRVKNWRKP